MSELLLSIDQETCTGCSRCPDYSQHFYMGDDGVAYVDAIGADIDPASPRIRGFAGKIAVQDGEEEEVLEAAEVCPGECIIVDYADSLVQIG